MSWVAPPPVPPGQMPPSDLDEILATVGTCRVCGVRIADPIRLRDHVEAHAHALEAADARRVAARFSGGVP